MGDSHYSALLDEVHWLIENRKLSFLLTGSSTRKLRRGYANMAGGHAWLFSMSTLFCREVSGFNLEEIMVSGLHAYIVDYLKEEIAARSRSPQHASLCRVPAGRGA